MNFIDSATSMTKLFDELILYNSSIGLAICRPCQEACPKDFACHLQRYHKVLSREERAAILAYYITLPGLRDIDEIKLDYPANIEVNAIEGLKKTPGFKCLQCGSLGAENTVKQHCQREHGWDIIQRIFQLFYI